MEVSYLLLEAKARQFLMFEMDFDNSFYFSTQQSMLPVAARAYSPMISDRFMSYDHFSCPFKFYQLPQV
jgi:hypothetical protein